MILYTVVAYKNAPQKKEMKLQLPRFVFCDESSSNVCMCVGARAHVFTSTAEIYQYSFFGPTL